MEVEVVQEEFLQFGQVGIALAGQEDQLAGVGIDVAQGFDICLCDSLSRRVDTIADELIDDCLCGPCAADSGIVDCAGVYSLLRIGDEVNGLNLVGVDQAGAQAVFEVVAVIGDAVGDIGDLAFERTVVLVEGVVRGMIVSARMLGKSEACFVGQVQAEEGGVRVFEQIDNAERLAVVLESADLGSEAVEGLFAGVAEGRVSQIVGQADRLGQALVEAEGLGDGPSYLGDFNGMSEPGSVEVVETGCKDLRLAFEASKGRAVNDAVAVALEGGAIGMRLFGSEPAPA